MKMYLPFGDWSQDGHRQYEKILIDAPSMGYLLRAQKLIKERYGENFFSYMADNYDEPYFSKEDIWHALIDTEYPISRLIKYETTNDWSGCNDLLEVLALDHQPYLALEFVEDTFIWLLNAFGAEITILPEEEDIPTICSWTCKGFETVGYGCFDD